MTYGLRVILASGLVTEVADFVTLDQNRSLMWSSHDLGILLLPNFLFRYASEQSLFFVLSYSWSFVSFVTPILPEIQSHIFIIAGQGPAGFARC